MPASLKQLIDRLAPPPAPSGLAVDFKTASRLTTLSESSLRRLARSGQLRTRKVGKNRRVIPVSELRNLVS